MHHKFVHATQEKPVFNGILFQYLVGDRHTMATALNVDGTLFLVDVGSNIYALRFAPRMNYGVRVPIFGGKLGDPVDGNNHSHVWRVGTTTQGRWTVCYKV